MRLKRFTTRLTDSQLVSFGGKMVWVGVALSVLLLLFAMVVGAAINSYCSNDTRGDWEYLSSFIEVMIAVNASFTFKRVRKWVAALQEGFSTEAVLRGECLAESAVTEELMRTLDGFCKKMKANDLYLKERPAVWAFWVAVTLTASLYVGIPECLKIFVAWAAFPLLLHIVGRWLNAFYCRRAANLICCHAIGTGDPTDDENQIDVLSGATGPVGP